MHEISLRITPLDNTKEKYRTYFPVGSVINVVSRWKKRAKWIEIICDLASPTKRDMFGPGLVQNNNWSVFRWGRICDAWTPQLRNLWREWDLDTPDTGDPLGLAMRRNAANQLWENYIIPTGVVAEAGKDPTGVVDVTDTWLWSNNDRRKMFVVVNDDMDDADISIAMTKFKDGKKPKELVKAARYIDWVNDLGLSTEKKADILNPATLVHSDFNSIVSKVKLKEPESPLTIDVK